MKFKIIFQYLLFAVCANGLSAQTDLIPFRKGNLWGFSKPDKTIVIPCQYDQVDFFKNHKALVMKGLKYGLIDETGKEIAPCQYHNPIEYLDGMARVAKSKDSVAYHARSFPFQEPELSDWGFLDEQGKEAIPCIYKIASPFQNGYAFVSQMGDWKMPPFGPELGSDIYTGKGTFIDKKGKPISDFTYPVVFPLPQFEGDLAPMQLNRKWGFINNQNKVIQPFIHDFLSKLNLFYWVRSYENDKQGLLTLSGKVLLEPIYESLLHVENPPFSARLAGQWGLFDTLGNALLPCAYEEPFVYSEGLAVAVKAKKYGFVDAKGNIRIPLKYDSVGYFTDGEALVKLKEAFFMIDTLGNWTQNTRQIPVAFEGTGFWGIQDWQGKTILPPTQYDSIVIFDQFGMATVRKGSFWGLYDTQQKKLKLPCIYKTIIPIGHHDSEIKEWCWAVALKERFGIANAAGELITPFEYDEPEKSYLSIDTSRQRHWVAVGKTDKWGYLKRGYIDLKTGKTAISCQYDQFDFNKDLILASKQGFIGVINTQEKIVLPFEYRLPFGIDVNVAFKSGLMPLFHDKTGHYATTNEDEPAAMPWNIDSTGNYGYINELGKPVIPFEYEQADLFQDGFAKVCKNGKCSFINPKNELMAPWADAAAFENGYGRLFQTGKTMFLDNTGKPCTPWIEGIARSFHYKTIISDIAKKGKVLMNEKGQPLSKFYYSMEYLDNSAFFIVSNDSTGMNGFGLIDVNGREIVPLEYQNIHHPNEEFFAVIKENKNAYLHKTKKILIESDEYPERIHQAYVTKRMVDGAYAYGLADSLGKTILPPTVSIGIAPHAHHFTIIDFRKREESTCCGILDATGKWLLPCEYWFSPANVDEEEAEENKVPNLAKHQSGKYGILDPKTVQWVLPCVYDSIKWVNDALYLVTKKDKTYFVSKNGVEYYQ